MGIFLLGLLIGLVLGVFWFGYMIIYLNQNNPTRFDQIIIDLRKKLKQLDN